MFIHFFINAILLTLHYVPICVIREDAYLFIFICKKYNIQMLGINLFTIKWVYYKWYTLFFGGGVIVHYLPNLIIVVFLMFRRNTIFIKPDDLADWCWFCIISLCKEYTWLCMVLIYGFLNDSFILLHYIIRRTRKLYELAPVPFVNNLYDRICSIQFMNFFLQLIT